MEAVRPLVVLACAVLAWVMPNLSCAADFPSKPVRIIVGSGAGSGIDTAARIFAEKLGPLAKQNVIVENRPGANEIIALNAIQQAEPDGHTLMWASSGFTAIPVLSKAAANLDIVREFAPVSLVVQAKLFLLARAGAPFNTPDELVEYMKQNPGKVNYAVGGAGAALLFPSWFKSITKTDFAFVRYQGGAQATQAINAGESDLMLNFPGAAKAGLDTGRAKLIGYTDVKRHEGFPTVPSLGEAKTAALRELAQTGFGTVWFGLIANGRTPPTVVNAIYDLTRAAARDADLAKRLEVFNMAPVASRPEEFAALIAREASTWKTVAKEAKMEPQ